MTDFGMCQRPGCEKPAIVGLNGTKLCLADFQERLKIVRETVERPFKEAR